MLISVLFVVKQKEHREFGTESTKEKAFQKVKLSQTINISKLFSILLQDEPYVGLQGVQKILLPAT